MKFSLTLKISPPNESQITGYLYFKILKIYILPVKIVSFADLFLYIPQSKIYATLLFAPLCCANWYNFYFVGRLCYCCFSFLKDRKN